jgi:transcription initiation factor IIE alpha subunit
MDQKTNNLLFWIDYLATSTIIDEMLEAYLLDDIEAQAQSLKNKIDEGPLPDGYHCEICNDYVRYAEPNQEDGTFVCYRCREGL